MKDPIYIGTGTTLLCSHVPVPPNFFPVLARSLGFSVAAAGAFGDTAGRGSIGVGHGGGVGAVSVYPAQPVVCGSCGRARCRSVGMVLSMTVLAYGRVLTEYSSGCRRRCRPQSVPPGPPTR